MISVDEFDSTMSERGWVIFPAIVPHQLLDAMLNAIHEAYLICRDIQVKNGIGDDMEHTVHHLPALQRQRCWLDYLESMWVTPYISKFFDDQPWVLNSMGGNLNPPSAKSYAGAIHRDVRSYTQDKLMLNTLVTLDPFTSQNGATWLLPGSHRSPDKPSETEFDKDAVQVTCPAGSVILFDSRVWHRAGMNVTKKSRRIITPIFTRPFFRPEFDYCRSLGGGAQFSPALQQIIGFNSRVPETLTDFYQAPEKRFYKRGQG